MPTRVGRPRVVLALAVIAIVATTCGVAARLASPMHLYTVTELQSALAQHPTAWRGRILLVRGRLVQFVQVRRMAVRPLAGPLCDSWCVYPHVALVGLK